MSLLVGALALIGETVLIGGVPSAYAWIDHHGKRNWESFRATREARGEVLDLSRLLDDRPVAEGRNFD